MNISTISDTGTAQAALGLKAESVPVEQQTDTAQVQQDAASTPVVSSQAVSVSLEGTIAAKLAELSQKIADQTALAQSLPTEIRELVQQLLNQTQAAATTLPEGLVALLKSSKLTNENLVMLVNVLEQAAGITTQENMPDQTAPSSTGMQQFLTELADVWQGTNPGDLQQAAKVLRELAVVAQANEQLPEQQATSGQMTGSGMADSLRQAVAEFVTQSGERVKQLAEQPGTVAQFGILPEEQAEPVLPNSTTDSAVNSQQSQMAQRPGSLTNTSQEMPANEPANSQQQLPQLLKTVATQPELMESLPPEIRKFVLTILQQADSLSQANQSASFQTPQTVPTSPASQPAPTVQTPQLPQTSTAQQSQPVLQNQQLPQNQQLLQSQQALQSRQQAPQIQQAPAAMSPLEGQTPFVPELNAPAVILQPEQIVQTLPPALAELLDTFNKSKQKPAEKLELLANTLEQTAELLMTGDHSAAQAATLRQQALVDEMTDIGQEKSPEELKAASKIVQQLADKMSKPSGVTAERQEGQKVLTFAVPLYFGEGHTVYPAYIHVYQQAEKDRKNPGQKITETWLRVCLETENIGTVDAAFRLYNGNNLDVKVRFNDEATASGFASSLAEVKEHLGQLPLTLGEFLVK